MLLISNGLQAQAIYTAQDVNRSLATEATMQNGGVAQELGVRESGRLQDAQSNFSAENRNPFRISTAIREGYDDNTNLSKTNRNGSFFTNFAAGVRYDVGTPRLRLTTNLTGGVTLYYSRPGRTTDLSLLYTLNALYAATERLSLSVAASVGYYPQPDVQQIGTSFENQDYFYTTTTLAATYQWTNRFSTTTSYNFTALNYTDSSLNDALGNITQTLGQAFNYQLWPTTQVVAEYRAKVTTYYSADMDSFGQFFLAGFNHVLNPRSNWNVRAGLEQTFYNNPVDGQENYLGPFGESILTYRYAPRSDVAWSLRYGTEQSGQTDVSQRQTFRTGISINHGLTPRITASAGAFYAVSYYDQPGVIPDYYQNVAQFNLGLRFEINRMLSLSAGYQFTGVLANQDQSDQDYYRNIVFLGLNANF